MEPPGDIGDEAFGHNPSDEVHFQRHACLRNALQHLMSVDYFAFIMLND